MRTFAVSSLQADRPIARAAERVASDTQLIIADGLCPKIAELLPGALHDVVAIGTTADPLAAISATLAERRLQGHPVDTLHLVAHGRPGAFQIGGQWITTTSLIAAADQLAQWQVRTLALWSCEVGADEHFMALLAELSGAAVHSSRQAIRKGNWNLTARNSSPNDGPEAPFNESTQETWAHELAFSDYNYYATFNEVVTATYEGGSSFSTFVPVAGSVFRLYPANPFDATSSVTEFFANGSTASVWLVIDGLEPAIELYLTNGAQASGGDGGPEDKWVIADAPNLNDATVFYVLASGTYQLNQAGETINSSISLADLDELAQSQLVATVASVTADDPNSLEPGDNSVIEGNTLGFNVVLSGPNFVDTIFTYALAGGTTNPADPGADITLPITWSDGVVDNGDGTITVPAGVTSFSATVQTFDDAILELTESLELTVGTASGEGFIIDNDFPAVDSVTPDDPGNNDVGDNAVVEGNSLRYDIVLNTAVVSPATYTYSLTGGITNPASVPADVTLPIIWSAGVTDNGDGTITVAAGVSTFSATVQTFDDTLLELTESLRLTVGGVFGTGNIIDNDFPTVDSVTPDDPDNNDVGDNAVVEGNSLRYDIVLNTAVLSPATYTYSLTGGTTNPAGVPADVTLPILWSAGVTDNGDGTITVAAGVSTFSATVQTFDDTLLELTESLRLTVGGVFGTGNIIDNDFPAVDSVTPDDPDNNDVGDNAVVEGNSLRYDIVLNTAVVSPATYTYSLTGGATSPASVPADVTLPIVWSEGVTDNGDGTITVATGVSSFFATVQTFDDTLLELPESLRLTVGGVFGTGNIIDNDFPAVSSVTADDPQSGDVDDDAVIEGNALRYDVELSAAVVSPATYTYSLSGGTIDPATVPDDVTLPIIWSEGVTDNGDGTITVATGVTSFFATVQTFDDELGEFTESLKLTIGSTSGEGHIIDNDDNDGIPSSTETALAEILNPGSGGDGNDDGIPDSEQPAVATLAWINTSNFTNAIEGDFPEVDPKSIITIESINNNGSVNNQTAFEDIEVVPFSVTDGQPTGIFTEWDPIEFTIVPGQGQSSLPDLEARGGAQVKVFINISAAELPENYFDKYYTYISADVIEAYDLADIPLVTLDGVNLDSADDAGWYDFTQRTAGGDGARYITEDGLIVGVEITFTDNSFGDDDPTANRIQDPSTLALEPDPQLGVSTDSGIIGDGVTGNGFAVLYMIGTPGSASRITLEGSDDALLSKGANGNYIVEEIVIDEFRSVYAIKLLDADLDADGAQAFGRYYTGKSTGNDDNTTDGFYTVLLDGQSAGEFEIRTAALSDRERIKCLRQLNRNSGIDSRFFGFRIDNTRGTNGDDNIIGGNGSQTLKGLKGSDVLNAWGDRLSGVEDEDPIAIPALNQKDVLTGGKGADYFQLGDIVSAFYLGDGDNGYARITDFSRDDRLILSGEASDYQAIATEVDGQTGLGIYQGGDLIALVQGKARNALDGTGTELNAAQVVFL